MRIRYVLAVAGLLVGAIGTEAQAQIEFEVTPFGGGTFFLADLPSQFALPTGSAQPQIVNDGSFENAWTLGLNAGFRFADQWAVEGMFAWLPTELSATSGLTGVEKLNGYMFGVTGLFYLPIDGPAQPFFGLGIGGETFDYDNSAFESHTELMGNVAVGLHFELTDMVGLRFEARDCFASFESGVASVEDAWENDLMVTLGMSFRMPIGG